MLIVALPVGFVMEFADVYRKCKKMWMERVLGRQYHGLENKIS